MKKTITILLAAFMLLTLVACGSKAEDTPAKNEITDLLDKGYSCVMSTADETQWKGVFQKEDSFDTVYMVTADMTAEKYNDFDSIGFDDPDADAKKNTILGSLPNVVVTDITNKIPAQAELDAYVGKTLGDLENSGFESTGWCGDPEDGYTFYYDGPVYCCVVTPAEGTVTENMDDYSTNDIRALKIGKVEFQSFSGSILD